MSAEPKDDKDKTNAVEQENRNDAANTGTAPPPPPMPPKSAAPPVPPPPPPASKLTSTTTIQGDLQKAITEATLKPVDHEAIAKKREANKDDLLKEISEGRKQLKQAEKPQGRQTNEPTDPNEPTHPLFREIYRFRQDNLKLKKATDRPLANNVVERTEKISLTRPANASEEKAWLRNLRKKATVDSILDNAFRMERAKSEEIDRLKEIISEHIASELSTHHQSLQQGQLERGTNGYYNFKTTISDYTKSLVEAINKADISDSVKRIASLKVVSNLFKPVSIAITLLISQDVQPVLKQDEPVETRPRSTQPAADTVRPEKQTTVTQTEELTLSTSKQDEPVETRPRSTQPAADTVKPEKQTAIAKTEEITLSTLKLNGNTKKDLNKFLSDLRNCLINSRPSKEAILDFFDELKKRDGTYKNIHIHHEGILQKTSTLFRGKNTDGEEKFWHTKTFRQAAKMLKGYYKGKLSVNEPGDEMLADREKNFLKYHRGNFTPDGRETASSREAENITKWQKKS